MKQGKKYGYRVAQDATGWMAEIIRKVTSKETVVSKTQAGFSSKSEAQEWGEKELKSFVQNLTKRNKQRSQARS